MTEFNQKVKSCWCDKCKKECIAMVPPMPYCPDCKGTTVIITYSLITGERITGNGKEHWLDRK